MKTLLYNRQHIGRFISSLLLAALLSACGGNKDDEAKTKDVAVESAARCT